MNTLVPYLLSAVSPIAVQVLYHKKKDIRRRTLWLSALIITVISNLAAFAAALLFSSHVSEYEFLYISTVVSVCLTMLLFPLVMRLSVDHIQVLKLCCIVCVCSAVYSILTYGQCNIHGDVATASMLTKAQLKYGSIFPKNWCYVNSDIWLFTVQTFVAPFVMLLKDQSLARMLGSALLVVVCVIAIVRHSKKAFHDDSWVISVPVLLLFLYQSRDFILYQACYMNQLILLLVSLFLFFQVLHTKKKVYSVLFFALTVILVTSGIRLLAEIILPMWLTALVLDYLQLRTLDQFPLKDTIIKWIRLSFFVFIPAVIGFVLHELICRNGIMIKTAQNSLHLTESVQTVLANISVYFQNLIQCFGFQGNTSLISLQGVFSMVSIVMCLLVLFVAPILLAIKIKNEDAYTQFFFTFTIIHNLIMFVLCVFFIGKDSHHYLLTSVFLTVFLSTHYIYKYWISQIPFDKYIWTALFIVALIVGNLFYVHNSVGWKDSLASKKGVAQQLVDLGLTKGYGDFWAVYPNEVYSDFDLRLGAIAFVDDTIYSHLWLVDEEVFQPEDTRSFLLLSQTDYEIMNAAMETQFQEPEEYYSIGDYHVYVYGYDIARDIVTP